MKRILFLLLDNKIGDTVIMTGFFDKLKKYNPSLKIDVLLKKPYNELLKYDKNINKIYVLENKILSIFKLLLFCLIYKYDAIFNQRKTFKRRIISFLIRKKRHFYIVPKLNQHITTWYNCILEQFDISEKCFPYNLVLPYISDDKIQKFLAEGKINLIFNPVGAESSRQFNLEQIKLILDALTSIKDINIILLDYKKQYNEFADKVNLFQSSDILETAALISKADIVLSVDTGIVHIADAFGKKIVDLFPSVNGAGVPLPQDHIVRWQPLSEHINLQGGPTVNEIPVKSIIKAVKTLMEKK